MYIISKQRRPFTWQTQEQNKHNRRTNRSIQIWAISHCSCYEYLSVPNDQPRTVIVSVVDLDTGCETQKDVLITDYRVNSISWSTAAEAPLRLSALGDIWLTEATELIESIQRMSSVADCSSLASQCYCAPRYSILSVVLVLWTSAGDVIPVHSAL